MEHACRSALDFDDEDSNNAANPVCETVLGALAAAVSGGRLDVRSCVHAASGAAPALGWGS